MAEQAIIHGSCVAIDGHGVIILGVPGSGKSDLVLRLIDHHGGGTSGRLRGAELVADDQVVIRREGDGLIASAPPALAGKLEVRGLGIVAVPALAQMPLSLAIRLTQAAEIERLPHIGTSRFDLLGLSLPLILIDPDKPSAPARIRAALDHLALD